MYFQKTFTKGAPWEGGAGRLRHGSNNSRSPAKPTWEWEGSSAPPINTFESDTEAVRHGEAKENLNREGSLSGCSNKMAHFSLKLIGWILTKPVIKRAPSPL